MRIRHALLCTATAGLLLACSRDDPSSPGQETASLMAMAAAEQADNVAICHFGGHSGDWVLAREGRRCVLDGGHVLVVTRRACEIAHRAMTNPWSGDPYNCAEADNIPPWWPGPPPSGE